MILTARFGESRISGALFPSYWNHFRNSNHETKGSVVVLSGFAGVSKGATDRTDVINGLLHLEKKIIPLCQMKEFISCG